MYNMAQNLKPNRTDNRGGNKPITSTKKLFIYRVERSMHEKLKAYAIELNKQVEEEEKQRYTIHKYGQDEKGFSVFSDLHFNLSLKEAKKISELKNIAAETAGNAYSYGYALIDKEL